ncbi:hypothetical protein ACFS07_14730 [Undibacterium arcticum]
MSLKQLPDLQPIGGTNKEVLAEIVQRIGLSFEQFTRAVLLAQNEFSAFLKADDNERGELLETLTGSAIYSTLSQRAYARAKQEQLELQRINDRLADQKPLSDEARSQLEQDSSAASAAVAALDLRKTRLDAQLRWHQDDDKFQQNAQLAHAQLQQRQADQQAAAARRTDLQRVESVQAARPLVAEVDRLARSIAQDHGAIAECQTKLASADQTRQQADAALEIAQRTLIDAEQAQGVAAPPRWIRPRRSTPVSTPCCRRIAWRNRRKPTPTKPPHSRNKTAKPNRPNSAPRNKSCRPPSIGWRNTRRCKRCRKNWPRWDILLKQSCTHRNEILHHEAILASIAQKRSKTERAARRNGQRTRCSRHRTGSS